MFGVDEAPDLAKRAERNHSMRMAMVIAVWEQQSHVRTADEILQALRGESRKDPSKKIQLPSPQNKVLDASLVEGESKKVGDMLAEMQRRDPEHKRKWVILVDGRTSQLETIGRQCKELGVQVTLVVNLLHVLHDVWQAGKELIEREKERNSSPVARLL